ncbi:MAG: GerMN domain-containing protein [bacterium]|nr:GerMN domain-containing protein [bacterium]
MKPFKIISLIIIFLLIIFAGAWAYFNSKKISQPPSAPAEIIVDSPRPNQTVASPFLLKGKARGNWYFEASFPVRLLDDRDKELLVVPVQAKGDWMTADYVPFEQLVAYHISATTSAVLVLQNDNPSGLPELAKEIRVTLTLNPTNDIKIKAYFNNNNLDPEISCNKAFAVDRWVAKTAAVARAALEQLLAGPTEQEKVQGYFTNINPGVKIQKLEITNGVAKIDFDQTLEQAMGGSCRVSAIRAQITETLKQFSTVKNVIISINGRTDDILQP